MRRGRITSEVFLRDDVENIMKAVDRANASLVNHLPMEEVAIYRAGFVAAMQAMAAAFDVSLEQHIQMVEPDLRTVNCQIRKVELGR